MADMLGVELEQILKNAKINFSSLACKRLSLWISSYEYDYKWDGKFLIEENLLQSDHLTQSYSPLEFLKKWKSRLRDKYELDRDCYDIVHEGLEWLLLELERVVAL